MQNDVISCISPITVIINYHKNQKNAAMKFMSESFYSFRRHNTVRQRIPHISNTFRKRMIFLEVSAKFSYFAMVKISFRNSCIRMRTRITSKSDRLFLVIPPLQKKSSKFVYSFLSYPVDRQTDRQTDKQTNKHIKAKT